MTHPWKLPQSLLYKVFAMNRAHAVMQRWRLAVGARRVTSVCNELMYFAHRVVDVRDDVAPHVTETQLLLRLVSCKSVLTEPLVQVVANSSRPAVGTAP